MPNIDWLCEDGRKLGDVIVQLLMRTLTDLGIVDEYDTQAMDDTSDDTLVHMRIAIRTPFETQFYVNLAITRDTSDPRPIFTMNTAMFSQEDDIKELFLNQVMTWSPTARLTQPPLLAILVTMISDSIANSDPVPPYSKGDETA